MVVRGLGHAVANGSGTPRTCEKRRTTRGDGDLLIAKHLDLDPPWPAAFTLSLRNLFGSPLSLDRQVWRVDPAGLSMYLWFPAREGAVTKGRSE